MLATQKKKKKERIKKGPAERMTCLSINRKRRRSEEEGVLGAKSTICGERAVSHLKKSANT